MSKELKKERERQVELNNLLYDSPTHYYIIKSGWYYSPNACGYTTNILEAGVYPVEEAVKHALSCEKLVLKAFDANEFNKRIDVEINELQESIKVLRSKYISI